MIWWPITFGASTGFTCFGGSTNSTLLLSGSSTANQRLPSEPRSTCAGTVHPFAARYLRSPSALSVFHAV